MLLFFTITFPQLLEGLPIVQPSRCVSFAEEVQNVVVVHPQQDVAAAKASYPLRATTTVPICDCHAGANPESASMLRYISGDLVVEDGPAIESSAYTVED